MEANQGNGLQAGGNNPHADGAEVLRFAGLADGRTAQMPPDLENLTPAELTQPSTPLTTFDQFLALWTAFYQTLIVKAHPSQAGVNIVATSFGTLTPENLQLIRESAPALAAVSKSPVGLYQTLRLLKQYEFQRTRNNITSLTEAMSDNALNTALGISLAQQGDDDSQPSFKVNMYLRLITHVLNSISHLHCKARAGIEAHVWFKSAKTELADLKMQVQDMLLALKPRSEANSTAQRVGSARQNCIASLREFTSGVDQIHQSNALLYLNSLQVHRTFSFTQGLVNLNALAQNATIWAHYFDIRNLDISAIPELAQIGTDLDPLLDKIRSYQPSRLDDARDQARNIRPNIVKLLDQIDIFFQSEQQSKGKAKSIILQIDGLRAQLQKLQSDGLLLDAGTIGTDQLTLEQHYAKLSDFVSSFEQKQRLEEAQRKLELQELSKASSNIQLKLRPLTGVSSWLQFAASMEEILQIHQSSLVKAQMIRNALKVTEDQISCRDLNYEEIMSWLQNKYSDSSLLPKLCDELLLLPQAGENFKQSYENLNNFFTTVHHLKKFEALDRLEKSYRDKLVPILLAEIHQAAFLARRHEKEMEWKHELDPNSLLPDDDSQSLASESHDPQLESRRLAFFISQMKFFLPQAHQLSKTQKAKKSQPANTVPRPRNRTQYNHSDSSQSCPVCLMPHTDAKGQILVSLSRCLKFKSLDVPNRIAVVKRHDYCRKCLRPKRAGDGIHDDGNCRIAAERDLACRNHDPPSPSHNYLLCLSSSDNSARGGDQSQRGAGRGGGRGRGGAGGRGRGRGRGSNTQANVSDQTQAAPPGGVVQFASDSHPVPRLICNKSSSHQGLTSNINLGKTRAFLSSACLVLALSLGAQVSILAMLDSGSGMGFITAPTVKLINPQPAKPWTGEINTLQGSQLGSWETYIIPLLDIFANIHYVRLICTPSIGFKDLIPSELFRDICHSFSLTPDVVHNTQGEYQILLGVDSFLLHGDRSRIQSKRFPDIFLMSTILSHKQYFIGAVGTQLYKNQTARTMTFNISASQHQNNAWSPISTQIMPSRNYLKSFYISTFLANISRGDSSESCEISLADSTDCSAHVQHMLNCNKAFVSFETKKSAASIDFELTQPAPQVVCQQCSQIILKCSTCKYIGQAISIKDLDELNVLRKCIRLEEQQDGRTKVFVTYPQRKDPNIIFSAQNSNYRVARASSIRLRQTLLKRNLLDQFHQMMQKTLEDNHCEEISFSPEDTPANFISLNYQEKDSTSQALRPVSNSSLPNRSGESLNSNSLSGPPWLGSGLKCLISFREKAIGFHSDISKFYRSVFTDERTNDLRRYFWFSDPHNEQTLKCYRFIRGNYGDTSISILTELIVREIISEACETHEVATACKHQRIVDDFCSSLDTVETAEKVRSDLIKTFEKFYFKVKHFHFSGMTLGESQDPRVNVLGLVWEIPTDLLYIKTQFFPEKKKRGRNQGSELSRETVKTLVITKEVMARLCGLAFCYTGAFLGPVQAALRISYSQICQLTQSWTTPCHVLSPELDGTIREMLANVSDMRERIRPFPRHVSRKGHVPYRIIGCSDGAKHGLGFTYHLVSRDQSSDHFISNIILARPAVHRLSIPGAELTALTKAIKSFDEIWGALQDWPNEKLDLIFLTDSTCTASSLSLTKAFNDVRQRNSNITIHRIFAEIVQNYPNLTIKVAHCEGKHMPGDLLTRLVPDPVESVNSELYRHGNKNWGDRQWPSPDNVYLIYKHNTEPEFRNAVPEQHSASLCVRCTEPGQQQHSPEPSAADSRPPVPVLSAEIYNYLFSKFSKLRTLLNVLSVMISWKKDRRDWSRTFLDEFSFKMILKTHQSIFGLPKKIKSMLPRQDSDNIFVTTTRLDSQTGQVMGLSTNTPIVNKHDLALTNMLIYFHHCQPSSLLAKLHLGSTLTAARIRSGPYSVWWPGIKGQVTKYISRCAVCNFVHSKPSEAGLSAPRFLKYMANDDFIFRYVSLDDVGPYVHRTHPNSRTTVKFWILIIADLLIGAVNFEIMESRNRSSVHKALFNHCQTYNKEPFSVFCDGASWIGPRPRSSDGRKYFKTDFEVTQYTTNHQFLNKSERYVLMYSKLLKSAFGERTKAHLPNMSFTEIRCLLASVKSCINSRPIYSQGCDNFILTANHLLFPSSYFEKSALDLPDKTNPGSVENLLFMTQGLESNLKILGDNLQLNHGVFIGLLKQLFILDEAKSHQKRNKFSFLEGDLVLLLLPDTFCRAIVLSVPSEQYVEVMSSRNKGKPEKFHNARVILLHRELPSSPDRAAETQPAPNQTLSRTIINFSSSYVNLQLSVFE